MWALVTGASSGIGKYRKISSKSSITFTIDVSQGIIITYCIPKKCMI